MQILETFFLSLSNHFELVIIGCIELLAAAGIVGSFFYKKMRRVSEPQALDFEKPFMKEFHENKEEAILLIRRSDMLPVYELGNLEAVTGISFQRVQEDLTALIKQLKDPREGKKFWNECSCRESGETVSSYQLLKDGRWIRADFQQSGSGEYDLLIFRQATETCEKFQAYEEKLAEVENASMSKTSFLYRMSHEIRTPMNGIMGMLTLAKDRLKNDSEENTQVGQYLDKAEELSGHLLTLINDILDMSRIEAGKVELEEKGFSLHALGSRLYDMFAKTIEEKGIRYSVNFEDMSTDWVIGDELRLSQILINFLSNAMKFTKKGEISLTFRQMMIQDDYVDFMICVHDTGAGMEPDFINRIFKPFEQENSEIARKYGGTGLGMAITDSLVRLMKGEIVVKSTPNAGSDFIVFLSLPIAEVPEAMAVKETDAPEAEENKKENCFEGRKILLAEDNEVNAMIATEILKQMGAEVDVAENGQAAVDKFSQSREGYYDLILMDVQMPVMNGRDAAKEIRKLNRKDAETILIFALSADAFVEDERASIESGMNGHFAKPIDFKELERNVKKFLK